MNAGQDPHVSLKILEAAVEQFPAYLRSGSISRPIVVTLTGHTYRPGISVGFLLDLIRDLRHQAGELTADERARLEALVRDWEAIRAMQAADYTGHLQRELKSHLDTWQYYLDDCARGSDSCADNYRSEARNRTRLAHLVGEADALGIDVTSARARLADLDRRLDALIGPGPFVGPDGQAERYPPQAYPWLHGRPKATH